jgi:hypothetical protein
LHAVAAAAIAPAIALFGIRGFLVRAVRPLVAFGYALLSTTAGGLAMLLGFVLLGETAGTYRISELVAAPPAGSVVTVAVLCVLFGAFAYRALAGIALLGLAKAGLFFVDRARHLLVGTVLTTAVRQPAMPLGVGPQPGRLLVALGLRPST